MQQGGQRSSCTRAARTSCAPLLSGGTSLTGARTTATAQVAPSAEAGAQARAGERPSLECRDLLVRLTGATVAPIAAS